MDIALEVIGGSETVTLLLLRRHDLNGNLATEEILAIELSKSPSSFTIGCKTNETKPLAALDGDIFDLVPS